MAFDFWKDSISSDGFSLIFFFEKAGPANIPISNTTKMLSKRLIIILYLFSIRISASFGDLLRGPVKGVFETYIALFTLKNVILAPPK